MARSLNAVVVVVVVGLGISHLSKVTSELSVR
jgi:hypothetical protein